MASGRFVVVTGEVGAYVGEAILLRDLAEGEFGALGDAILEARPERMRREKRGEKLGRTEFGTGRHGTVRLCANGRPKVERVATKDGDIVDGGFVRPLETKLRLVNRWLGCVEDAG